jgi:hypothetical protein
MADLTITIPSPILMGGQYFKERHRLLPSGGWSATTNRSNAPFSVSGLSVGDHEFEFVLVNADGTHCPAVYRTYTLVADYECITFASEMKKVNGLYHIEVSYTLPGGFTDPACGWEVVYHQNSVTQKFTLATLPTSGVIKIPCQNYLSFITIRAQMCNGRNKECYSADVLDINEPPCIPMSGVVFSIREVQGGSGRCEYYLDITFTRSNPATTTFMLRYAQNSWSFGYDSFVGVIAISPTATSYTKKLDPVFLEEERETHYDFQIVDACGNSHSVTNMFYFRPTCWHATP